MPGVQKADQDDQGLGVGPLRGGGGLLEDTPVICGGHSYNKECYKYDKARTS